MPKSRWQSLFLWVVLASIVAFTGPVAANAKSKPQKVAFIGFRIINDALEPISNAERRRAELLDKILVEKLEATGRFQFISIPETIATQINAGPYIGECNGCEIDYGRKLKADLIAWGTVQKVSNLILNLNVYIASVHSGQMTYIKSVDIRGNSDRSWTKGLKWMLKHYMPGQKNQNSK